MVDFRYHLVSIIAVFLALAVGLVLGTTALNGPVLDRLRDSINGLTQEKRGLEDSVRELRGRVDRGEEFARMVGPQIVEDVLVGERVVVVQGPGAPAEVVTGLVPLLTDAGARVVARVQVRDALLDPAQHVGQARALVDRALAQHPPAPTVSGGQA